MSVDVTAPATTNAAGFRSLEAETHVDALPLDGALPPWLTGSLLRTGPARWEVGDARMRHWFDGFAMLHRFAFSGGAVSYANRMLDGFAYRAAKDEGRVVYSEFATDPCRSIFQRVQTLFKPGLSDNANVNLGQLGERFMAMTETPLPVEFDARTLQAAGIAYEVPGHLTTAHPHRDRDGDAMLNYAAKLGPRSTYRFFRLAPGQEQPTVLASLPVKEPAYMHSFGLSERWLVLAEFPLVVNPLRLAAAGKPYIENYRWKPELGTRFTLVDRQTGATRGPFTTDTCFAFHHVNAFDDDNGDVVIDLAVFDDARIIDDLYLDRLRAGRAASWARLERFRISPGGTVDRHRLCDEPLELPRINYGRHNERPYRYVWAAGATDWLDRIVKVDVTDGSVLRWQEDGCFPGEPVFVAAPAAEAEDDGVLLSVVLDGARETSFLLVLDAADLSEVARARVPHHIPFGFHGQYTSTV